MTEIETLRNQRTAKLAEARAIHAQGTTEKREDHCCQANLPSRLQEEVTTSSSKEMGERSRSQITLRPGPIPISL